MRGVISIEEAKEFHFSVREFNEMTKLFGHVNPQCFEKAKEFLINQLNNIEIKNIEKIVYYKHRKFNKGKLIRTFFVIEVFCANNFLFRQKLRQFCICFYKQTGWFLVVRGRYVLENPGFIQNKKIERPSSSDIQLRLIGFKQNGDEQQSFKIKLSNNETILLDFGRYNNNDIQLNNVSICFLSHFHPDHSGNIRRILLHCSCGVFMSARTAQMLWIAQTDAKARALLEKKAIIVDSFDEIKYGNLTMKFYPVAHCIGSMGVSISDGDRSFIYTGDIYLGNQSDACANWKKQFQNSIDNLPGGKILLLDGSRGPATHGSQSELSWTEIIREHRKDIAVVCRDTDRLVLSYVRAYHEIFDRTDPDHPVFVMSKQCYQTFAALKSFLKNIDKDSPEGILYKVKQKWGYLESQALFWQDEQIIRKFHNRRHIWFFTPRDLNRMSFPSPSDVHIIDLSPGNSDIPNQLRVKYVVQSVGDQPAWTQHSKSDDLLSFISWTETKQINVFLFHLNSRAICLSRRIPEYRNKRIVKNNEFYYI